MASCAGDREDHCCFTKNGPCQYLVHDVLGRRNACGLRIELGSWDAVHRDRRYRRDVKVNMIDQTTDCGDWPPAGQTCAVCGIVGGRTVA